MISKLTTDEFLDYLKKSCLTEESRLEKTLDSIRADAGLDKFRDSDYVSQELVKRGLITSWHVRQLMKKKYKGFYLRQYRILGHLGSGGMSTVYLAEHTVMHRRVAIKVLPRKRLLNSAYLDRFVQEAQAIASLDHPNIVRAYDLDRLDDIHYIVMEYFEGVNLRQLVEKEGPLAYEDAVNHMRQAALGLGHAHRVGIIHRDVKPDNLLVNDQGVLKILDLGLAMLDETIYHDSQSSAGEDKILGTADYLAPEQAVNSHKIDARADIYGLGGTLYFCLTGHPPFPYGTIAQRIVSHQKEKPKSIFIDRPDAPADLVRICEKMMEKKPDDRFASAEEVVTVLERWLIHHGVAQPRDFPQTNENDLLAADSLFAERFHDLSEDIKATDLGDAPSTFIRSSSDFILTGTSPKEEFVNLLGSGASSMMGHSENVLNRSDSQSAVVKNTSPPADKEFFEKEIGIPVSHRSTMNSRVGTSTSTAPKQQEKNQPATTQQQQKSPWSTDWYREVPMWFWTVFAAGYVLATFLAGILFALLTNL